MADMDDVDELPRPFGPYMLLARLARGGMGEVFFAKHGGLQGFEKHCVVKTLREDLANADEYVRRFTEEARVVVQLSHRDVCSVFDVGRAGGQLYVAMEHIVGRDLRALVARGPLSPALSVHIVSEVLEALDYAHRFVDADTDEPLSLVHRDVSPHNVLVSAEGDVKLIDFGIATSARVGPVTEEGTVLGKLSYMAPEHARGDPVDGRADQYSAAVLLVELLTGTLFNEGLSREETWRIAGIGGHRPAAYQKLDAGLRAVLDRALQPARERRFPTCSMFGEAIVGWARERGYVAGARDVRRLMSEAFPGIDAEARALARGFADVRPPALDAVVKTPGFETIATTMMVAPTTAGLDAAPPDTVVVRDVRTAVAPARRRAPAWAVAACAGVVLALAAGAGIVLKARADAEPHLQVVKLPPSLPPPAPAQAPPAVPDDPPGDDDDDPPAPPSAGPDPPAAVDVHRPRPPPRPRPSARIDAETRHNLAFISSSCMGVVTCANGVVDWSRRRISPSERDQLASAAADCAKQCRLRR